MKHILTDPKDANQYDIQEKLNHVIDYIHRCESLLKSPKPYYFDYISMLLRSIDRDIKFVKSAISTQLEDFPDCKLNLVSQLSTAVKLRKDLADLTKDFINIQAK